MASVRAGELGDDDGVVQQRNSRSGEVLPAGQLWTCGKVLGVFDLSFELVFDM